MRRRWFTLPALILASGLLLAAASNDCSFLNNPDQFTSHAERFLKARSDLTSKVALYIFRVRPGDQATVQTLDAAVIPRKNFIDDAIFGRMAADNIRSAPLASDLEFLRRVTLDLTGRIPSAADAVTFVNDPNPLKRDLKVDALIGSPEFVDKWTMFLGDLYKNNAANNNIERGVNGRDAFYLYLKEAVSANKPYDQLAREIITATGDSFAQGQANWPVGNTIAMGPVQDTYDGQAVNLASMFLGINVADCLLCHDGARHLDQVNLWGSKQKRPNMWGLSAYFARTRMQRQVVTVMPQVAKYIVSEASTGEYQLNTTSGNRVARQPINGVSVIAPNYPFATGAPGSGALQPGENRRQALARQVTGDIQFSRAIVNYVWEKFMVQAFISPSNTFDLARLDPDNPPPAPWTLQPTNPQLLQTMAEWFQANDYDLRALMALIAKSNAYQLSATYPGTWNVSYVPYYARRYVRRLDAEEVHDAIAKATGIPGKYTIDGSALPTVQWAMQFPDTQESGSDSTVEAFLNAFGRGDRDTMPRRSDGTILQSLDMLNSPVVLKRIHQSDQGSRVATLLSQTSDPRTIIWDLFMNTLSRPPTDQEIALYTPMFLQSGNAAAAADLEWVLLNKIDFLFNY
jgi:Protein of unknown function (DUF1549)/Protein of unknown function (DUF1553)